MSKKILKGRLPINIVFPAIISIAIFLMVFFLIIIPYYETSLMNRKQEMIQELTNSALSILYNYHEEEKEGLINQKQAKELAIDAIENLRYGDEHKDYFWITDMIPTMIAHPYRPDLNGKNLMNYKDPHGKKVFIECVRVVKKKDEGFVHYMWQWKDDKTRIVPKLSFVKGFEPWGWIIGTGIYLEDVRSEIKLLRKKLIIISIFIILFICIILTYIVIQNIRLESKKQDALNALRISREKYKSLVDASTEGILMVLNNKISYVNSYACKILEYTEQELYNLQLNAIIKDKNIAVFNDFFNQNKQQEKNEILNFETALRKKDGKKINTQLHASSIIVGKDEGFIITIKILSSSEQIKKDIDLQVKRFKTMTDHVNIGVFRASLGKKGSFIDINNAALQLLEYSQDEISKLNMVDIFSDKENKKELLQNLLDKGKITDQLVRIKTKTNSIFTAKVSLFISRSDDSESDLCDGIIQDISLQIKAQQDKDQLVEDLQLANLFLNQAVKTLEMPVQSCFLNDSIKKVVQKMAHAKSEVILVQAKEGTPVGIFSDSDLRKNVIGENIDLNQPIHKVMVAPLVTISENKMLFEAILKMRAKEVKYICMTNTKQDITGLLSLEDLANAQHHSQTMLIHRIKVAITIEELKACYQQLAPLIRALMDSGMKVHKITRLISDISDEITKRVIHLCQEELSSPPVKYSFVTLGSVGRKEQTLATDQDNAIIFDDVAENKKPEVQKYFLEFGSKINSMLDYIGYTYCDGEVMARNPKWCQPVSVWKNYFNSWLISSTPQSIIDTSIFYDMRFLAGDKTLTSELTKHISEINQNRSVFLYHLAQSIISIKPPINFFGSFIVESGDEHKSSFDIKQVITILTGFLRVYSLQNRLSVVNSLERLNSLINIGIFTFQDKNAITDTYNYLMTLRMKHQLELYEKGIKPDNYINPTKISEIERSILKKIFSKLSDFQSKLGFEYKGTL